MALHECDAGRLSLRLTLPPVASRIAPGAGKSAIVREFAACLGYPLSLVPLFRDMTAQDLLQRRRLDSEGNTSWEATPLVEAALGGGLCVLDGLHRLRPDGLASLQQLLTDGEAVLFDGTRLLRAAHYDALATELGLDEAAMVDELAVRRVHPAFRVIALAEPPDRKSVV